MSGLFFRPADGFVGDVIPFFHDGLFHAFYLRAPLGPIRRGANHTAYAHAVSRDLVRWEEWPDAIAPGPPGAPDDVACWTGCVVEHDGRFLLFYTGYPGKGRPQSVCLAMSDDLRTWTKDPGNPVVVADERWYEPTDWRDPFVFRDDETGEFRMLLAGRTREGPRHRRGCLALAASSDLRHWEVRAPIWQPRLVHTHECPDVFRWGDGWALVYSEFSDEHTTRHRMADTLDGPWRTPVVDSFDTRAHYAAKTVTDGKRRFLLGWLPTRDGSTDGGRWDWGGCLVVHELVASASGDGLAARVLPELDGAFADPVPTALGAACGDWSLQTDGIVGDALDGFAAATLGAMPVTGRFDVAVRCDPGTRAAGVLLRCGPTLDAHYMVRWEPRRQRVVFDRWPRAGDVPFVHERPVIVAPDADLDLTVVFDGSAIVVYVAGQTALSARAYDHATGDVGLFVMEGAATFSGPTLKPLARERQAHVSRRTSGG